jgi:hypothetical protein
MHHHRQVKVEESAFGSEARFGARKQKFPPPTKSRGKGRVANMATVADDGEDGD